MDRSQIAQRSIIKKYRSEIWKNFVTAVNEYALIQKGDRIAACISGGKDSMLMAMCLQELQRHGGVDFDLVYLSMDPGYSEPNRRLIEENARLLGIPVRFFETNIFRVVSKMDRSPCYMCARMRRGHLYSAARDLGCNKIALGHHFDDMIETVLMSLFYSAEIKTMMPKLRSRNFPGMELIRPMYRVRESAIIAWGKYNDLRFLQCACRFTEGADLPNSPADSKRLEMKALIAQFRQKNRYVDMNIFKSVHNVNLDTVIGYCSRRIPHRTFLDDY